MSIPYYRIEFWHTTQNRWCEHTRCYSIGEAERVYKEAYEWHYAKQVRIVKVTEEVIRVSKETIHGAKA